MSLTSLSYRDVCDLMAERGVTVAHTAVSRWVQCFVPAFEEKWKNYARPVGSSWRVDETYIKVNGQWRYLYRAVDKQGQTVDFLLTKNRDQAAAIRFFKKAIWVLLQKTGVLWSWLIDFSRPSHTRSLPWPNPIHSNGDTMNPGSSFSACAGICVMPSATVTLKK
jgi:hypothetical protein